ncbi:MAG: PepSY domain-containing protein [Muricoprocola sp.]
MKYSKKNIVTLSLSLLIMGSIGTTVLAANVTTTEISGNTKNTQTKTEEKAEDVSLTAQAKITEADAIKAAEQENSGYTFTVKELDSEDGNVVYELEGTDGSGAKITVFVNAEDGTIQTNDENEEKE